MQSHFEAMQNIVHGVKEMLKSAVYSAKAAIQKFSGFIFTQFILSRIVRTSFCI